jgi:hypothetical protein
MAGILGTAEESVCRIMSAFRRHGVIQLVGSATCQCDIEALKRIASGN